jgi:arylsulfatase
MSPTRRAPDILLVTCDQLRKDALGCYGNSIVRTPVIDRLAGAGVRFENVFVASPVCAPNRGSIVTGRFPSVHGLSDNGCLLPASEITLMEVLRAAGYTTLGSGKMHFRPQWAFPPEGAPEVIGPEDLASAIDPQPQPWEFPYYGFTAGAFTEDNRVGRFAEYLRGEGLDPWADPHSFSPNQHATGRSAWPAECSQTSWIVRQAIELLEAHADERPPIFMWVSFVHPHHPFIAPAPFDTLYTGEPIPLPIWDPAEVDGWPTHYRERHYATDGDGEAIGMSELGDADWRRIKAHYWGMLSHIDDQLGRLLERWERRRGFDDTVVMFTSDHGEMLGDHHLLFKDTHYDCVTNVPLIVRSPDRSRAGEVSAAFAQSIDLMPTLLEHAGLPAPPAAQGRSLSGMLQDPASTGYADVLIENPGSVRTLRTAEARLSWHGLGERGELYDLRTDPDAVRNLWSDSSSAALKAAMMERLLARISANVDPANQRVALC